MYAKTEWKKCKNKNKVLDKSLDDCFSLWNEILFFLSSLFHSALCVVLFCFSFLSIFVLFSLFHFSYSLLFQNALHVLLLLLLILLLSFCMKIFRVNSLISIRLFNSKLQLLIRTSKSVFRCLNVVLLVCFTSFHYHHRLLLQCATTIFPPNMHTITTTTIERKKIKIILYLVFCFLLWIQEKQQQRKNCTFFLLRFSYGLSIIYFFFEFKLEINERSNANIHFTKNLQLFGHIEYSKNSRYVHFISFHKKIFLFYFIFQNNFFGNVFSFRFRKSTDTFNLFMCKNLKCWPILYHIIEY